MAMVADGVSSVPSIRTLRNGRFGCMSALDQREHLGCLHGRTLDDVGLGFIACIGERATCTFRDGSQRGCLALDSRRRRSVGLGPAVEICGAVGEADRSWTKGGSSMGGN